MKRLRDADFEPERHAWDGVTLVIDDGLQKDLDKKLISAADLREAIWMAETSGDVFVDAATGTHLASMIKPVITYWVEYRKVAPQTYEVLSRVLSPHAIPARGVAAVAENDEQKNDQGRQPAQEPEQEQPRVWKCGRCRWIRDEEGRARLHGLQHLP